MKKFLLILLLLALPFQYTWSAAAVYCQHEPGKVTHFGHHTHQHPSQVNAPDGADKHQDQSKQFHNDCEYCHMYSHATALPTTFGLPPAPPQSHWHADVHHYLNPVPDGPKRPDWLLVA